MAFLKKYTEGLWHLLPGLLLVVVLSGCSGERSPIADAEIIAGTTLITDIVNDISNLEVEPYTLLPSTSCPSQFDMKPHDITKLQQAKLVLLHAWQLNLANIRRTLEAAKVPGHNQRIVEVAGNWMIPDIQKEAVQKIMSILIEYAPESEVVFRGRTAARLVAIGAVSKEAHKVLPPETTAGISVLCHEMQAPFLQWLGFSIAGTFNRPEDWSVADAEALVQTGRERQVGLVVDNLQSGGLAMSATLAKDIGAGHMVLSNFPGGFPDTPTWQAAFEENVRRLRGVIMGAPGS